MQNLELKNIKMKQVQFTGKNEDVQKTIAEATVWALVNGVDVGLELEGAPTEMYFIRPSEIIQTISQQCNE